MSQAESSQPQAWAKIRRSQRLALSVAVIVYREPQQGSPFHEGTHTLVVNAHGALISLTAKVAPQQTLMLKHSHGGEEKACRVVFTRKKMAGPTEVGIEFLSPSPKFWRIAFPPADWPAA